MAKLHELKRQKAVLVTKMSALVAKEEGLADGETLTDADSTAFSDLKDEVTSLGERIGRLEDMQAAMADAVISRYAEVT